MAIDESLKKLDKIFDQNIEITGSLTVDGVVADLSNYLTSFTETDPTVPSHVKSITSTNITNWNTAYDWGNHADAGYLTSSSTINADTVDSLDSTEFARGRAAWQQLNFDSFKQPGLYQYDSIAAGGGTAPPDSSPYNFRTIEIGSANRYSQIALGYNTDSMYFRRNHDGNWSTWRTVIHDGNKDSYTYPPASHTHDYVPERGRSDWNDGTVIGDVIGQLAWKNYGNSHTIFDASAGSSPDGTAVDNSNSQYAWAATYPTLMGWNGSNTYGVRVDSARVADNAGNADSLGGLGAAGYMRDDGWNTSPGQDANTQTGMRSDFSYSNNAPHTGDLIRFGSGNYSLQLSSQYGGSGQGFSFRTRNGDTATWNSWYQLIHAGNIGSQTVNYSAGADTVDGLHASSFLRTDTDSSSTGYIASSSYIQGDTVRATNANDALGISFRSTNEVISGEGWCTAQYAYNNNDGFLFVNRDSSANPHPVFHIGGHNNANYAGYGAQDSIITLTRLDGTKSTGSAYAGKGLSNSAYYTNIIKTTAQTIFNDSQGSHVFNNLAYANGSFRAPLFYDSNDTTYYLDPASTSLINNLAVHDRIRFEGSVATDDKRGMYFSDNYDEGYAIYREAGGWSNPFPDLRIGFHTGIKLGAYHGYNGIRFYDNSDMITQVMSINNTSDPLGANNVYVNGSLQAGSSLRAPVFYDSNDTSLYLDPTSTSVLNYVTATEYKFRSSTNNARFNGVSDWGTRLYTDSGYIQFGPANAGHAHIYTDRSNFYFNKQIQLLGTTVINQNDIRTPILYDSSDTNSYFDGDDIVLRGSNPEICFRDINHRSVVLHNNSNRFYVLGAPVDSKSYAQIDGVWPWYVQLDTNSVYTGNVGYAGGSYRAPIFYDSADTAYYADPGGTSRLARTDHGAGGTARNGDYAIALGDGALHVRSTADKYHKIWYYDGIAFGTNYSHGHFRFYGETNTQRNASTAGAYIAFDIDTQNFISTAHGTLKSTGDIVAYSSDARLKENVRLIEKPLDKLKSIRGVIYDWKDVIDEYDFRPRNRKDDVGVIAQEVEAVMPQVVTLAPFDTEMDDEKEVAVSKSGENYKTVQYEKLVPLLIEAVKELSDKVEYLENQLKQK